MQALSNIYLSIRRGEIFGIIGPDGAGKTSLFRILATLLVPQSGRVLVEGLDTVKDYKKIRTLIGYMPGKFSLYQDLSVEENLRFFATVFNTTISKNYETIKRIYTQLEPFKTRRAGALSGGMKQKLALCCALIHTPKVLFLDEPTTGVDPVSRAEFWQMLASLKAAGLTIVVSTPYMDEAELCDRIALIQNGRFLTVASPAQIRASVKQELLHIKASDMFTLLAHIRALPDVAACYSFGEYHHALLKEGVAVTRDYAMALGRQLQQKGHSNVELVRDRPGIEDCFLLLSGGKQ